MTFNVLAQCYVRSTFFPYCDSRSLRWKTRSALLKNQVAAMHPRPDIVCLQECDNYDSFWKGLMATMDYSGIYVQKTGSKKDGVAIFWQHDRFEHVHSEEVHLKGASTTAAAAGDADLADRLLLRDNVGLVAEFRPKFDADVPSFVIATTHLFWDPKQADVKLAQTEHMLAALTAFTEARPGPVFFAGDFNSLPDSAVYARLTDAFGSAYAGSDGEPAFTNCNGVAEDGRPAFVGTLDYILFDTGRAQPTALAPLMSLAEATAEGALPNRKVGSDHLPLVAEFAFLTPTVEL
ncbi:hypothetical protein ACHHYP_03808 [Achlya hypogyna]|uniref:Endonuclease/exonuclease/phosphatase domain-containing protein n=1 Tax=Achlya hypogyna TaxID=1202772 RepID=A0A1V9Z2V3_ACHHY|nr:hypothetical protein ACHHYP_03808 [Achlya hypogyna]